MKKLFSTGLLCILAYPAFALPTEREYKPCCRSTPEWYAGFSASAGLLDDLEYGSQWQITGVSFNPGLGATANFGYLVTPDIGIEIEGGYRTNKIDSTNGTVTAPNHSSMRSKSAMANVVYTHHTSSLFSPYFGAGGGMVHVKAPHYFTIVSTGESRSGKDWVPGYQLFGGVTYDIPQTPMEIFFGYRYFTTSDGEVKFATSPATAKFGSTVHSIELGAKIHF